MRTIPRVDQVRTVAVIVARCKHCDWTYRYGGQSTPPATMALARARAHAFDRQHQTEVHRSTGYDGRRVS